jgi:hypothetical protein
LIRGGRRFSDKIMSGKYRGDGSDSAKPNQNCAVGNIQWPTGSECGSHDQVSFFHR